MGTLSPPWCGRGGWFGIVGDDLDQWAPCRLRPRSWAYPRQSRQAEPAWNTQCGGAVLLKSEVLKGCRSLCVFSDIQLFIFSSREKENTVMIL